jgi:glycosyltransferase involved in cell wall biosynthesis
MRLAIQNIHQLSGIQHFKLHNYALELVKQGYVDLLFFDDPRSVMTRDFLNIYNKYSAKDLGILNTKISFRQKDLNKCDVLLNFDSTPEQFTPAVKQFKGLKIFHAMDYFWYEPFKEKARRLKEYGIDYLMGYNSHDLDDSYFQHYVPDYDGKCIPVPFGFTDRFNYRKPFSERNHKCAGIGSAQPMALPNVADPINWQERSDFFKNKGQEWFHPFRRKLVENKDKLADIMDSYFPDSAPWVEYRTDMAARFNDYKMFVCDESALNWPCAKTFEGPISGCVLVCSDHPCFTRIGFEDGVNCIKHKAMDIDDFRRVVSSALQDSEKLEEISKNGRSFVEKHYSHTKIASKLYEIIFRIHNGEKAPVHEWAYDVWKNATTNTPPKKSSSAIRRETARALYHATGTLATLGAFTKRQVKKIKKGQ